MADYPFATSQQAADIAGITPAAIGVPANNYVRKQELVAVNKFDVSKLASYANHHYVLLKDVARGVFGVSLSVNSDISSRATVQINSEPAGTSVSKELNVGDSVTIRCNLPAGDTFDGWYSGGTRVSTLQVYTFTLQQAVTLVARAFFLDVSPLTVEFEPKSNPTKQLTILTNLNWLIE